MYGMWLLCNRINKEDVLGKDMGKALDHFLFGNLYQYNSLPT